MLKKKSNRIQNNEKHKLYMGLVYFLCLIVIAAAWSFYGQQSQYKEVILNSVFLIIAFVSIGLGALYHRKSAGAALLILSIGCVWMFHADIYKQQLFKDNGKQAPATVAAIQTLIYRASSSSPNLSLPPVSFDYTYRLAGEDYTGHTNLSQAYKFDKHKGDTITVVYLDNDHKSSLYIGDVKDLNAIAQLVKVFCVLGIVGLIMFIWPNKKKDEKSKINWAEMERLE